jgi:hypothetical protein
VVIVRPIVLVHGTSRMRQENDDMVTSAIVRIANGRYALPADSDATLISSPQRSCLRVPSSRKKHRDC